MSLKEKCDKKIYDNNKFCYQCFSSFGCLKTLVY